MSKFATSEFRVIASGLEYPEGPVYMPDGSVLLVEIKARTLTRILPDGSRQVVANTGGGPNGAAIGPGGKVFICNNGGLSFIDGNPSGPPIWLTTVPSPDYTNGSIQVVDGEKCDTLYTDFHVPNPLTKEHELQTHTLKGPDDLVFDETGGFWFTDWGKQRLRDMDITGVYYAQANGSKIDEALFPVRCPNGIALSPDGTRLYVAETYTRKVMYWKLKGPGQIKKNPETLDGSYLLTADLPGQGILDSMAVDEEGNVYVATMIPKGMIVDSDGGIVIVSPEGDVLEFLKIESPGFAPLPSNICFGGADRRTAYITLGGSGYLVAVEMRIPGLKLAFC